MIDQREPWALLRAAYEKPWEVADRWRADGGKVVGVLGRDVPRELIAACGLLPIRLSPLRLDRHGNFHDDMVPEGLASQLATNTTLVLGALLAGAVDWVDALAIGRDSELHANLFYAIRELSRMGDGGRFPSFAFCDLLRLPTHNASRYNRVRTKEFAGVIERWSNASITSERLSTAISDTTRISERLAQLDHRRVSEGTVSGTQMLVAAGASQTLPPSEAEALLTIATELLETPRSENLRIYVTGSGLDSLETYETLERDGALIVGEDHEWGDSGHDRIAVTPDPWDGLVDRYHLGRHGAPRSGVTERVIETVKEARDRHAELMLQVIFEHDDAPGWESPALKQALGPGTALTKVRQRYGEPDQTALSAALERCRTEAAHG